MAAGRYILFKKIARGGMAEIYLGKQVGEDGFQRLCCIKRILPHYAQEEEFIEMFRDEAHICKRLQHANIVRVEGFEEVEGSYAIIMEFVNGADVRSVLSACEKKSQRLSVPMAVFMIAEAARGLHFSHTKIDEVTNKPLEIVHRDISPQNILVSFEGEVKVTDFGIADAESKATETKPGIVKGKYSYMSPEQISAKPVDARTDVFALAIVLWEMLAMRRLFQGDNEVMTIQAVKNCKINRDIVELNPQVDDELSAILHKGLKKDVRERYASAAAFEKDLRRYLNKRFSDFTSQDLGQFLKTLLAERREESLANIKQLLSDEVPSSASSPADASSLFALSGSGPQPTDLSLSPPVSAPSLRVSGAAQPIPFDATSPGTAAPNPPSQPPQGRFSSHGAGSTNLNRRARLAASYGAGAPQRGGSIGSGFTKVHQRQGRSNGLSYVLILVAILLVVGGGYLAAQRIAKSKLPGALEIRTTPAVVKVKLDGRPIENHAYIKTPLVIKKIKKGEHTITFSRDGFADETLALTVEAGEEIRRDDIVLKQVKKMAPVRVTFKSTVPKEVRVVVDRGILNETIRSTTVLNLEYITFGESHTLTVYPRKASPFKCQFVPRAQSWRAPYLIVVSLYDNRCKFPPR